MANLVPARPEQTQFPLTRAEAEHAVRLWFIPHDQTMTLMAWRDTLLKQHLTGLQCDDWRELAGRTDAWNESFNNGLAKMIAGGACHV